MQRLRATIAACLWCCAVCLHSYEADTMQRDQDDSSKHQKVPSQYEPRITLKKEHKLKERNRTRMSKCKPLPSMIGTITRVGFGGFQFTEHMGNGGVMQGQTVMCGRFKPENLAALKNEIVRIHVSKHTNRVPVLVAISSLSGIVVENMEREGLL